MPDGAANAFTVKPAVRVNTPAFVAFSGPSGSGKTRSALELATGLAGDGKILVADTEGNRALHYADLYQFDHVEWRPPFTPERNAALIDLAEKGSYAVLIIDSESDEFEGEGGLQEIAAATKDEFWARTKARHKHELINRMRRAKVHIIFCLRAEEQVKIEKVYDEQRRKEVVAVIPLGWQPICEKRFLYEVQSSFLFDPSRPGEPQPIKLYDIHAQFFPSDRKVSREAGRQLAQWCSGGRPASRDAPVDPRTGEVLDASAVESAAWAAAVCGTDSFREYLRGLSGAARAHLADQIGTAANPGPLLAEALRVDEYMRSSVSPAGSPPTGATAAPPPAPAGESDVSHLYLPLSDNPSENELTAWNARIDKKLDDGAAPADLRRALARHLDRLLQIDPLEYGLLMVKLADRYVDV